MPRSFVEERMMFVRLASVVIVAVSPFTAAADSFKAGVATVEITPPVGLPLWGYASRRDAPSTGVRDPLWAKCVVLESGTERIAVVGLDLGRPPTRGSTANIRRRLAPHSIHHIFLVASHSHHGPVMELDNLPDPHNPYTRQIETKICELVVKAVREMRPARLSVASTIAPLNRNRQSKKPDAPVDQTLTVARVEAADGTVLATLVNYAAHPTTLPAKLFEFSADYPGVMARRIESETRAPCLFLQGASGDLSVNAAGTDAMGEALAKAVLELTPMLKPLTAKTLRASREEFTFRGTVELRDPLVRLALTRAFFSNLVDFYDKEYRDGVRPELTVAAIGDRVNLVGMSGEFFCAHALSLRRRARDQELMFCGYCNDYQQYFPTIEASAEGGYGTVAPIAVAEPGAGERMTDRALIHILRLRGKLPTSPAN